MAWGKYVGAFIALTAVATQPCAAADDFRDIGGTERRSAVYGGATVRIPLGGAGRTKPSARLQLTSIHTSRNESSGAVRTFRPAGIELGAAGKGAPTLFINGQSSAEVEKKLGIGGSTVTTVLIVGGILLVLAVVAAANTPPQVDFDD